MKHIILGTSGHIDHGKTSLIKSLTGIDTDTLKEEKKRGITINNGYAHLEIDENIKIGIIDVPGHEKFIKNMVAGVSTIDLVLFVIGADDGVMPQTIEHLNILKTLGIKKGIIVITKVDLVDEEWIALVKEDIKNLVKDSFLENSPIVEFSAKTNLGLEELKETLIRLIGELEEKDSQTLFRMPIDRVFQVSGFGNVITGTIIGGNVKVGSLLELYPGNLKCKVRGIQVHGKTVEMAYAGDRTAINLVGVDKESIKKGLMLGEEDKENISFIIDIKLDYFKSNVRILENRQRIRIHHGTREILGRIVILDKEDISPGESCYCQIRLEDEICARKGDRIVIRSFSPIETIGGGLVLEANANKAKRFKEQYISDLKIKESGAIDEKILTLFKEYRTFLDENFVINELNLDKLKVNEILEKLLFEKKIIKIEDRFIDTKFLKNKIDEINEVLNSFYKKNSLKKGIPKEEIKSKIFDKKIKKQYFEGILNYLVQIEEIELFDNKVGLKGREIRLNLQEKQMKEYLLQNYIKDGFKTRKIKEVIEVSKQKEACKKVYEYLKEEGELIELSEDVVYSKEYLNKALEIVKKYLKEHESINLSSLKEILNISRKYLIAILEYCDNIGLTYREEEGRKILK